MDKPRLALVKPIVMGDLGYLLTEDWESALDGWVAWLHISGIAAATKSLRRDNVRCIARRSKTGHPRQLTLSLLIELFAECDWSNEHRRSMRSSLKSFFAWCLSNGITDDNPAELLPKVKGETPKPRPTPDDAWRALLDNASPRELLMARLAGEAGLRRAEVARTKRDDLVRDRTGWALIVLGKGAKQRVVPITDSLAAAIMSHTDHGWLFPGPSGGHITPAWVGTIISGLLPPGVTMHGLRHRYASRGYAGTKDLRAVQTALGHASVATTQRYTAVTHDDVRAVSEAAGDGNDVA